MNAEEYRKSPEARETIGLFQQAILLQKQALEKLQTERQTRTLPRYRFELIIHQIP
jgi:hypothetical protein